MYVSAGHICGVILREVGWMLFNASFCRDAVEGTRRHGTGEGMGA